MTDQNLDEVLPRFPVEFAQHLQRKFLIHWSFRLWNKREWVDLFCKSMGVILGLPSSSASSKSMSSSLSESDSINCSTLVLNFACGGFFSRISKVMFLLETGDDFVLGGDIFGRKFISSRPAQTRIIEATFQNCPNKFYTTSNTLPYSYFSACLISQCCVEAREGRRSHPSQS